MVLASSDMLTSMPGEVGGYKVLHLCKMLIFPSLLTGACHTFTLSWHCQSTFLQVKTGDSLDLSLQLKYATLFYPRLPCAIHFRDMLQDGYVTASSLASSGAVWKLALGITTSGEKKPQMKCFCQQAWPYPPWMLPERGKLDRSFVKGTGMGIISHCWSKGFRVKNC